MILYFSPMSCSLASRISLYEAGLVADFQVVDLASKKLADGSDYFAVNPKGQVPTFVTRDGEILTEGPAVLQHIADLAPDSGLAPPNGSFERSRLQMWLNYVATEIHKAVFYFVFNPAVPDETRTFVMEKLLPRQYAFLAAHLDDQEFLLDRFTVADAYLVATLNWAVFKGIDLSAWPALDRYYERAMARPSIARAMREEAELANG
ncbi:hypothetical protein B2G71_22055 [Novosphingobium sp. PC22D]|uniref:glutathione binding-like protein n=1 Tax=Novosphingobium sp. PC22D TaxID=1962403 RepID=UPI000BEFB858|nr:glutathione binding-like protein [Novosphingobium sp. PC22D]PEQ10512.1 hypothetical protein B2G71_22055 [Novosphingobium sp. PC22D]